MYPIAAENIYIYIFKGITSLKKLADSSDSGSPAGPAGDLLLLLLISQSGRIHLFLHFGEA